MTGGRLELCRGDLVIDLPVTQSVPFGSTEMPCRLMSTSEKVESGIAEMSLPLTVTL